jgi:hypothetical protein
MNTIKIIESFEKLDLQLSIELWFTENDYKPGQSLAASLAELVNASQKESSTNPPVSTTTTTSNTNESNNVSTTDASSGMQQLCARTFKLKFDLRHGLHVQIPVLFDYFHLSSVVVTLHSSLLTLLPPVMLGYVISFNNFYLIYLNHKQKSVLEHLGQTRRGMSRFHRFCTGKISLRFV